MSKPFPSYFFIAAAVLAVLLLQFAAPSAWATTVTNNFTTAGTTTWTCPAGVTSISVAVQGGGGAGGAASTTQSARGGGGGGGGCAYSSAVPVVPGTGYTVTVGGGGAGGSGAGAVGGDSSFSGSGITTLTGGKGGGGALNTGSGAAGGFGGTASGGAVNKSGGTGDTSPNATAGGGGGGGGGTTGAGGTASGNVSGLGGTGSPAGGAGGTNNGVGPGGSGYFPSGGGGGSYRGSSGTQNGGAGAKGQITITYTSTPAVPAVTTTAATSISTTGATLNGQITSNGGASVTDYGFYYGTVTPVTTGNSTKVQVGTSDPGTTPFSSAQTGLSVNTHYYFATYAVNSAGTTLDSSAQQNFWTLANTPPPSLLSTSPTNNATNVLANASLVATFDETIVAGTGSIELRRSSDASLVESFDVTSSPRLTFGTAQLIIQPTSNLVTNQQYYVLIPFGAVKDTFGNSFAGITSTTGWRFTVPVPVVFYTDTGSPTNPPWIQVSNTVASAGYIGANYPGPVYGSLINVNNAAVEVGLYGNRPISVPNQHIHVACNTSATIFANFTRWFQTDGNTHVLRVFVDDENTATARTGTSSHTEAFMGGGWNYTDNMTYEWSGHYTVAYLKQGYAAFQLKNTDNDWAFQLSMGSSGTLGINNRNGADVTVTNADGTAKNFNGGGFDMRVLDDGKYYKVWIDGVLYASGSYTRPTGTTTFRWGMYFGANNLNPPADYNMIFVSGPQIKSWSGNLATATTTITKTNNTSNLDTGASWVGGVAPGLYNQAVWDGTVTTANTTTLASYQQWAGLKILNPGGAVTINGSATLGLDDSGVDLTTATQNLAVNCPVQLTASSTWGVAPGRTATFNGIISGFPDLTVNGGGTVQFNAANTYSGDTTLSAGTLVANNNSALGAGLLVFNGGNLSNSASCTLVNDVSLSSNATAGVGVSQTLTLNGSIAGTGSLTKNGAGTLTLSGANSYTNATIVNGGRLVIKVASFATNSTVTVAGGAVLQLDFATTNLVTGFVTNGVSLPPGVYKAANAAPFITGIGSLQVVGGAPPPPTIAPVTVSGTNLLVSVSTVSGANYVLQSATNLTPTINWQNESTNAGTGGILIFTIPIQSAQPMKFLRFWVY